MNLSKRRLSKKLINYFNYRIGDLLYMDCLRLNISNLNLNIDLSEIETDIKKKLTHTFFSYISQNSGTSSETIAIMRLKGGSRYKIPRNLEDIIEKSLELPLNKFPFSRHPLNRAEAYLKNHKTFLRDPRFVSFFDGMEETTDMVIYPLNEACLLRRHSPVRSALFLKSRSLKNLDSESIREAIHLTSSMALPLVDSIMLHGVGIERNGIGHLFLGNSGSGKSTIARYTRPEDIISDDGIIAERLGSEFRLARSPIDQARSYAADWAGHHIDNARLHIGYFLKKDKKSYMEKVLPSEACSVILKNHIHYLRYFPQDSVRMSVSVIAELCRNIPFYQLHFRKDSSFWNVIDDEMSKKPIVREEDNDFT